MHFAWQAQYLLMLEGDFTCSTHWKWLPQLRRRSMMTFILRGRRSIWWGWRVTFRDRAQHFVTFWEIAGTRNVVFYNTKSSPSWDESGLRSGGCEMTILWSDIVGYRRISSDVFGLSSNRLSIGGSIQGVSAEILSFKISWQAQCLVRLEGDLIGSAHWKWRFICDADHRGHSFCVAGAVFGDVGGWLYLLHALEMTSHLTSQISDDIHFAWQAQYLVRLAGDFSWQAQHFVTFWEIAGTRNVVF